MKVVATIEARMASSRLPGKILSPILDRPLLELLIERVKRSKKINDIVIATTKDSSDDVLTKKSKEWGVGLYRGSTNNVLDRVLNAARKFHADIIVELTGDCPLLDPEIIDQAIETFQKNEVDYVANVTLDHSWPRGLDVQVYPTQILARVAKETTNPFDCEHVSLYIYSHPEKFRLKNINYALQSKIPKVRLTVDTEKDLELIRRIYHLLYGKNKSFTTSDIFLLLKRFPKLFTINNEISQKPARYDKKVLEIIKRNEIAGQYSFKPKYRAAIIGCGQIASLFDNDPKRRSISSHAGGYNTNAAVKLVAACDINRDSLSNFGKRWDVEKLYENYLELLEKETPDIVSITTKSDLHYPIAKAAVKSGVKAIFCEKPFTDSLKKAREIVQLCKKRNVVLTVNYNRRFDKTHRVLAENINKYGDLLGGIFYYVNGFINNASHAIDLIRMLFGDVQSVLTVKSSMFPATDANLSTVLTMQNGTVIYLQGINTANYYIFEGDFFLTEGRLKILDLGRRIELYAISQNDTISAIPNVYSKPKVMSGLFDHIPEAIENIISTLEEKITNLSSGEQALATLEVLTASKHSLKTGKKVYLPLKDVNYPLDSRVRSI